MKVNSNIGQNLKGIESTPARDAEKSAKADQLGKPSSEVISSSKVNVSERAQMMQKAKEIASQDSIDEAKVARLQKMIDEGSYKVDAGAVAERLLGEHLTMPE